MTLLLLPNLLGPHKDHIQFLPQSVEIAAASLDGLIAESEKAGRLFLSRFMTKEQAFQIPIALNNKNTRDDDIDFLLEPIKNGETWGLISDCGLPCLADPGSKLVFRANQLGIKVNAFAGPSSIYLALMLSGLPGQCFSFLGYLDKDINKLKRQAVELERESKQKKMTQIFMERPYQNQKTLQALLEVLNNSTYLTLAWELTNPGQRVITQTVKVWKTQVLPNLDRKNTIFLIKSA